MCFHADTAETPFCRQLQVLARRLSHKGSPVQPSVVIMSINYGMIYLFDLGRDQLPKAVQQNDQIHGSWTWGPGSLGAEQPEELNTMAVTMEYAGFLPYFDSIGRLQGCRGKTGPSESTPSTTSTSSHPLALRLLCQC